MPTPKITQIHKILWSFVTFTPYQKSYIGEKHILNKWIPKRNVKIIENIVASSTYKKFTANKGSYVLLIFYEHDIFIILLNPYLSK